MVWQVRTPAAAAGRSCESLAALTIPNVTVHAASVVAGPFTPLGAQTALTVPSFCRVEATARPSSDSEIRFEVWIPPVEAWNGKFQGVGNGGYRDRFPTPRWPRRSAAATPPRAPTRATPGTTWCSGKATEKVIDYGWRATHVMTDTAKLMVRNAQGRLADKSHFVGCSAGGHQAMSEVQRFPDDYDGVVAGAPAHNRIRQAFGFMWSWTATHTPDGKAILTQPKLALVTKAAVEACDSLDGLKDGLITDPRTCIVRSAKLACKGADDASCLTPPQVDHQEGLRRRQEPAHGEQIYTGWARGSEGFGEPASQSWRQYLLGARGAIAHRLVPLLPVPRSELGRAHAGLRSRPGLRRRASPPAGGVARPLRLQAAGQQASDACGGWMDPVVPPQDTAAYYEAVAKALGGYDKTRDFFRLFMAPGMGHCAGGPGPNQFDALTALEQWVEKGVAPETLIASHSSNGKVDRTRPLCAYPQVARYKGAGSIDDASNFACVAPAPVARPACTSS